MSFKVGDVCEIVGLMHPENLPWLGRQCVVLGVAMSQQNNVCVRTTEMPPWFEYGWFPEHLRKINPPNWTAPLTTDREVSA